MKTSNEVKSTKTKKIKFYVTDELCAYKVIVNKNKGSIKVKADAGYTEQWRGNALAELSDDGNGVTVSLVDMPEVMYLDYAQLDYLRTILNAWEDHFCNGN